jgi:hypothetical protein
MTFHRPTQWQLIPKGTNLLGHSVIPPRYGQVEEHNFQANVMKQKRIQCTYSNVLRIRVTHTIIPQTHYLMEQNPLLLQNQADGMDVATVDR